MDDLKRPERAAEAFAYSAHSISGMGADAAAQFWDRTQSVVSMLMSVNADGMKFIQQRIARSNEMLGGVARCRSLPDILEVESQWFRAEFDDYSEYGRRLADLNSKLFACVSVAPEGAEPTPSQPTVPSKSKQISQPAMQAG